MMNLPTKVLGSVLDLLLTNMPGRIVEVRNLGMPDKSDYLMIQASVVINREEAKTSERVLNWGRVTGEPMMARLCSRD